MRDPGTSSRPAASAHVIAEGCGGLDGVNAALLGRGSGNRPWTAAIKQAFVDLGKRYGFYTCASGVTDADHGEWLYDVCWLEYASSPERLIARMPLAMECEWAVDRSDSQVMEDFQKLSFARADILWMVFQCSTARRFDGLRKKLARQMDLVRCDREGGACQLSCWIADQNCFRHEALITAHPV